MARYGINTKGAFGVPIPKLRALARELGPDHQLALALWQTGLREARLLAIFLEDPARVSSRQMDSWARGFDSWDVCDQACTSLFDVTEHAWTKAPVWCVSSSEWVKRAGFALMAGLAVHDKHAEDQAFLRLLPLIERGAFDERNFVKKAVNWALRNLGKRNMALHVAAQSCAERILRAANRAARGERGGDAPTRAARWVALDALRELRSEKTRARLQASEARSAQRRA